MATGVNKMSNMVDPEVMATMIDAQINSKSGKFAEVTEEDNTLVGRPGDTVTVPTWGYIGDAADLVEGASIPMELMTSTTTTAKIKQIAKGATLLDTAVLSGFGDPIGQINKQIAESIVQKKDRDIIETLSSGTVILDNSAAALSKDKIIDAIALFGDEDDDIQKYMYIHPNVYPSILKMVSALPTGLGDAVMVNGVVTQILGCMLRQSNKCKILSGSGATAVYAITIAKKGAVKQYNKRGVFVETDRDITKKATLVTADKHYTTVIEDQRKVVVLKTKK